MSKSIHTTYKNLKGLTKSEIDEQANEPSSDLHKLAEKSKIKKEVKRKRKELKKSK
jgi:hypothetical protein